MVLTFLWAGLPLLLCQLNLLLSHGANLLVAPFGPIGLTLLYYDRRIRVEAYDLVLRARALEQPPSPNASLP